MRSRRLQCQAPRLQAQGRLRSVLLRLSGKGRWRMRRCQHLRAGDGGTDRGRGHRQVRGGGGATAGRGCAGSLGGEARLAKVREDIRDLTSAWRAGGISARYFALLPELESDEHRLPEIGRHGSHGRRSPFPDRRTYARSGPATSGRRGGRSSRMRLPPSWSARRTAGLVGIRSGWSRSGARSSRQDRAGAAPLAL
jgi:hypothetical protein